MSFCVLRSGRLIWGYPTLLHVGMMGRTVELDKRGRLLLPAEIRNRIGSKRFLLKEAEGKIELEPLPSPKKVKGKYQGLLDKSMEDLEEDQEKLVKRGDR